MVIEEWRGRLGAGSRITDKQLPVIFQGSRYAERLPIGLPEILQNVSAASGCATSTGSGIAPDQMAVVVVGDMPVAEAEQLVRAHFGGISRRATGRAAGRRHERAGAQGDAGQRWSTDPEAQGWP